MPSFQILGILRGLLEKIYFCAVYPILCAIVPPDFDHLVFGHTFNMVRAINYINDSAFHDFPF